jgi:hypothetical protein
MSGSSIGARMFDTAADVRSGWFPQPDQPSPPGDRRKLVADEPPSSGPDPSLTRPDVARKSTEFAGVCGLRSPVTIAVLGKASGHRGGHPHETAAEVE